MRVVQSLALIAVALACAGAVLLSGTSAHAATVKDIFEKYQLLGALAADCSKPVEASNPYLNNRVIDADHVEIDRMVGTTNREFAAIVDKASESKPNELTVGASIDDRHYDIVFRVESGRIRAMESTGPGGKKVITGGREGNSDTPSFGRCLRKVTIHNAPEGGGKCLQPLYGEIKAGARLSLWDCNDLPPQIFSFDTLNGRLMVSDLCVDLETGVPQGASIQLPLAACSDAPSQTWKTKVIGNYLEIVANNDWCIDISNYAKTNGAAVALWRCHGESNQRWQFMPALDLTFEPTVSREGHTFQELNLTAADPKICQSSCVEMRQCSAWVYRKPEGRTDHHAHCWLLDKTTKTGQDSFLGSGVGRPETPPPPGK